MFPCFEILEFPVLIPVPIAAQRGHCALCLPKCFQLVPPIISNTHIENYHFQKKSYKVIVIYRIICCILSKTDFKSHLIWPNWVCLEAILGQVPREVVEILIWQLGL